jgi:hypothetical protein
MANLTETSLTSMKMKAAFPTAPDPIQGIPTLASLIDLMLHMCRSQIFLDAPPTTSVRHSSQYML